MRRPLQTPRHLREGVLTDEREIWIRHFFYLALFAAGFHTLQFLASFLLWKTTASPILMSFGLDAAVSAIAALVLAARVQREWRNKFVAYGYMAAGSIALYLGGSALWSGQQPKYTIIGLDVAA